MTTAGFIASWVLFIIAGFILLGKDIGGENGNKVGGSILMIVVAFLTSGLVAGLTLLGSA
ncbi:MAG: hypothetical protein WA988_00860 [Candidatus Nanopelagicales bacterium]